jgi:hypothetical protein
MTEYAKNLVAVSELKKKRAGARQPAVNGLTSMQAGRTARRYQKPMDEKGLSNLSDSVSTARDRFFVRRGLVVDPEAGVFGENEDS